MIRPHLRSLAYVFTAAVSLFYFCWYCKRNSANFIFSFKLTWKSSPKYQKICPTGEMKWYHRNKNSKWGEGKRLWLPINCALLKLCCWPSPWKRDSQTSADWKTRRLYFLKKLGITKSSTIWLQTTLFYTCLHSMNSSFQPNWPACHSINMLCVPDFSLSIPTTCMPYEPPSYKE